MPSPPCPICAGATRPASGQTPSGRVATWWACQDTGCTGVVDAPVVAQRDTPRYVVDYEAISYTTHDPIAVIEELVDRTRSLAPGFRRERWCAGCENWDGRGKPSRLFAADPLGPGGGCAGCVLSHLDENPAWLAEQARRPKAGPRVGRPLVRFVRYVAGRPVEEVS